MLRSRLWIKVYAAFVVMLVGLVFIVGCAAHLMRSDLGPPPAPALAAAEFFLDGLPEGEDFQPELARRAQKLELTVGLWTADGTSIASTGAIAWDPADCEGTHGWFGDQTRGGLFMQMDDGRWLAVSFLKKHFQFRLHRFLAILGLIGLVLAAGSVPVARGITRRIERLREGVDRLGEGDLKARVRVQGSDEIAQLAAAFNKSADHIEELVEAQRRMLASASHELRSPLARVRMALELLRDGVAEDRQAYVEDAVNDIAELDSLVGDLLAAVLLEADGATVKEPVDVVALVRSECERTGAELTAAGYATVQGDGRMLRVLVRNLLENARRHAADSAVEVSVTPTDGAPGVELVVSDRGPGVDEADRERIFEPFYRPAGHREGADGGVGLGLALARQIARAHGGDVTHHPREGGGSRFVVLLA
ncbi:MAG: HAMP domain-containing histidine kinase [Proteobacteria bacterium]|nr:HAMP domain-containing histidine kinase [Pseudomonadota bacterium]